MNSVLSLIILVGLLISPLLVSWLAVWFLKRENRIRYSRMSSTEKYYYDELKKLGRI